MARTGTPLDALERVARNLPVSGKLKFRFVDTVKGRIRFAYGEDGDGCYHGVWAVDDTTGSPLMARPIEFKPGNTEKAVVQELVTDATFILNDLDRRGMTDPDWWRSKRENG
jgi:hypothetical protein